MKLTVEEIAAATEGVLLQGSSRAAVRGVSIDSRVVKKSDVFVAIKGERFDAHRFVKDVIARGVRVVVVQRKVRCPRDVHVIVVDDTTKALGRLAAYYRRQFDIPVIAITGTAGKTTTKNMIAKVLRAKYKVLAPQASFNNHIGVPLTLFQLKPSHDMAVIEAGTNQPGDMAYLADIIRPDVAVFTNIGEGHLEKLKTPTGVFKEKRSLAKYSHTVVVNQDDDFLRAFKPARTKRLSYGIGRVADYRATRVCGDGRYMHFRVGRHRCVIKTPVYDYVYNALVAVTCGRLFRVPYRDIVQALSTLKWDQRRQHITRVNGVTVINDVYNANPVSCRSAIRTLVSLSTRGRRWVVLGDMKELGAQGKKLHRALGDFIAQHAVDGLIAVGALAKEAAVTAKAHGVEVASFTTVDKVNDYVQRHIKRGDVMLIKGSRAMQMERVLT